MDQPFFFSFATIEQMAHLGESKVLEFGLVMGVWYVLGLLAELPLDMWVSRLMLPLRALLLEPALA